MHVRRHFEITGGALWNWFKAQCYDSLAVAILWFAGLWLLGIPLAPLWAILAGVFQFIPHLGPVLGMIAPVLTAMIAKEGWLPTLYVLILYAAIVVVDGLVLQPYIMRRTARVPIWASILVPIVMGLFFNIWGVILSAPLLAILYAYKAHLKRAAEGPAVEVIPPPTPVNSPAPPEPPTIER